MSRKSPQQSLYTMFGVTELRDELCVNPKGEKLWCHTVIHENFRTYCSECGMLFQIRPTTPNNNKLDFDFVFDVTQLKN